MVLLMLSPCGTTLQQLIAQAQVGWFSNWEVDWANEVRLILTALLLGSTIVLLQKHLFATRTFQQLEAWTSNHFRIPRFGPQHRAGPICARPKTSNVDMRRTTFTNNSVAAIYGWPSRGGVIILERATNVDLTFLGLDVLNPPLKRDYNSDLYAASLKEDSFCQRLLLLGAKWWDSVARYHFVEEVDVGLQPAIEDVDAGRVPEPTLRERRWVRVGWENDAAAAATGSCGLWLLDCDLNMHGVLEEENMVPENAGRIGLARSMRERCEILNRLGARSFNSLAEYEGKSTFLRAWEWKYDEEVGELAKL